MKHSTILLVFCALFGASAMAQSSIVTDKQTKRITITAKKTDENGKVVTETWIAEGEEPSQILKEMAIHPDVIQKVEIDETSGGQNAERLFLFRAAGEKVAVEGTLDESADKAEVTDVITEVMVIRKNENGEDVSEKTSTWHGNAPRAHHYRWAHDHKSNCAALGVWITGSDETMEGAYINGLIENGGAKEAGLLAGDMITKIDEFDIDNFSTLTLALSHFKPGDVVTVRYDRDGKSLKAKVNLKGWAELPGHEWRSRGDCQNEEPITQEKEPVNIDDPTNTIQVQPLELKDARIYPNPTDGDFALSFTTEPGPVTVSITDVNGKVVFSETNPNLSGAYNRDINLKDVPQGNYIVTITQGDKVYTQQISKQ